MFRNNLEPEMARLVREQTTKDKITRAMREFVSQQDDELDQAEGAIIDLDSLPTSTPSYIKHFIDIDHASNWERIKIYLSGRTTESLDDQIAKYQKIVDDNAPVPDASSRKERRRKRERELCLPELTDLLAARALRAVEHERGLVAPDGVESMPRSGLKSLDIQHWPYTLFNTDRLKAMREYRLKTEKAEAIAAKKEFNGKIKAELKGKRKMGHWEFKTDEDEVVARVFMRSFETLEEENLARVYADYHQETNHSRQCCCQAEGEERTFCASRDWCRLGRRRGHQSPEAQTASTPDVPTRRAKIPKLRLLVRLPISTALTESGDEDRMSLDSGSDSELTEFTEGSDAEDMNLEE